MKIKILVIFFLFYAQIINADEYNFTKIFPLDKPWGSTFVNDDKILITEIIVTSLTNSDKSRGGQAAQKLFRLVGRGHGEWLHKNVKVSIANIRASTSLSTDYGSFSILLRSIRDTDNNVVVLESLENVKKGVFSGETLTKLFLKDPLFPPTFSQLISVGEQTGQLDEMFGSVAKYYESEFDTVVDNLSSLIEPIMIVFMGLMIGGLMIAMYSPIFNVGALIG